MGKTASIIVAGGRDFDNYDYMCDSLDSFIENLKNEEPEIDKIEIISGMAQGADFLGITYGIKNEDKYNIHVSPCEPKFWMYGDQAGVMRNVTMAERAKKSDISRLVVFWNHKSKGTKNMIDIATTVSIPVTIFDY